MNDTSPNGASSRQPDDSANRRLDGSAEKPQDDGRVTVYVYTRDHSVLNHRPSTTHGAYARHAANAEYPYAAACDSRITLNLDDGLPAGEGTIVCRRRGCQAAVRRG